MELYAILIRQSLTFTILVVLAGSAFSQSAHKLRRDGDLMYDQREYLAAEEAYRKANDKESTAEGMYNLGSAVYNQERYEEAVKHYSSAAETASAPDLKSAAYFNLGNTYVNAGELEKGIGAYIESLKILPDDLETKKNLTRALQQLKQQQQQQQQQDQQGEGEEQEEQQQQNQGGGEDQEQQQEQQAQAQAEEEESEASSQPQEQQELTKEEAEELLRIIESEDQRVQEKLRKGSAEKKKPKKDW